MNKSTRIAEQRREDRQPAEGEIQLSLEGAGSSAFLGNLIDSSRGGFRASHRQTSLAAGQQVRFLHSLGEGRALVMWNRILEWHVESGFLILDT
jgi:hypothetical protein